MGGIITQSETETTQFVFRLSPHQGKDGTTQPSGTPYTGDMIRILIIEEHDLVRQALETRLSAAGELEVLPSVGDYTQAVQQAQEQRPDVILMETKTLDGMETLSALCKAIPWAALIVLTSYTDSREEEVVLEMGACAYLLKSLETEALVAQIQASAPAVPGGVLRSPTVQRTSESALHL